jgi:hypothetical protein
VGRVAESGGHRGFGPRTIDLKKRSWEKRNEKKMLDNKRKRIAEMEESKRKNYKSIVFSQAYR